MLGSEGKGVHSFIANGGDLAYFLLAFNFTTAVTYFTARQNISKDKVMGIATLIVSFAFVSFAGIIYLLYHADNSVLLLFLPKGYTQSYFLLFLLSYFAYSLLSNFYMSLLQGQKKFAWLNLSDLTLRGSTFIAYSILYYIVSYHQHLLPDLPSIFYWLIMVNILLTLLYTALFLYKADLSISFQFDFQNDIRPFFNYTFIGYLGIVANFFNRRLDIWFVEHFHGVEQWGFYSIAVGLTGIMTILANPLGQVLMPYLTQMNQQEGQRQFLLFSRINAAFITTMTIGLLVVAHWLVPLVYGSEFSASVAPLYVLAVGNICFVIRNMYVAYNYAHNRVQHNLYGNVVALVATVIFDILLIPKYGIWGAALATSFSYCANMLYVMYSVHRHTQSTIVDALILKKQDLQQIQRMLFKK